MSAAVVGFWQICAGAAVIRQISSLFNSYLTAQMTIEGRPAPILDSEGRKVGHVEMVVVSKGRLRISGWANAAKVTLVMGAVEAQTAPRRRREDVAQAFDIQAEVGFELDLPCHADTLRDSAKPGVRIEAHASDPQVHPVSLEVSDMRRARTIAMLRFIGVMVCLIPTILRWYTTRQPIHRVRVKARLGLNAVHSTNMLDDRLLPTKDAQCELDKSITPVRVTLILPIYNAFDLLSSVLKRVETHTDLPWRLVIVEDCSTDDRVRPFLREWVAERVGKFDVILIENARNRGFIRSVNKGLARALKQSAPQNGMVDGPVILLNSDAFVPTDWASRLVRPLLLHRDVASVTPMSNDAEIFSTPTICAKMPLEAGQGDQIDAIAQRLDPDMSLAEAPTGVGFCMALSRAWLARVPELDTAFGRGYGEEVDWCQKTSQMGARHLVASNLFVEHRGGESFGTAAKQALITENNAIISKRYPDFDAQVQRFLRADPVSTARLALGMAWAGSLDLTSGVAVYLAHSLGGGAETYLQGKISAELAGGAPVVVLRVGGTCRWHIELHTQGGVTKGGTGNSALMRRLIGLLSRRRIIYSCGVGDTDAVTLPAELLALKSGPQDTIEVLFHDFFPLSPSYTLLGSDGVYRRAPQSWHRDKAHRALQSDGCQIALTDWQESWRRLAEGAEVLRVFSQNSAEIVRSVWPDLSERIVVAPHAALNTQGQVAALPLDGLMTIAVLGNIGFQKGAGVVQELARMLGDRRDARLVVIGNIDPSFALPKSVRVHGDYQPADIPNLSAQYHVTHWLIPSIWPETFSYTTREALGTGRPVLAFDIGAQGDAIQAAQNGMAVPLGQEECVSSPGMTLSERAARNVMSALKLDGQSVVHFGDVRPSDRATARMQA